MARTKTKQGSYLVLALALGALILAIYIVSLSVGRYLQSLEDKATALQPYQELYKGLAGYDGQQKTLLLLANNAELRLGGGFIGTVGMVTSDKGKISAGQLTGVYTIDATNTCTNKPYQPPDYLKSIGPCASLRDSSNQLDFPQNAKQAMYYYQQVVNQPVNNVVQFTPSVLEVLLAKLGPVYLKDYDLTITKDNFREKVQLEVEAGKDKLEKKDPKAGVLGGLANQLVSKLLSKDLRELNSLFPTLQQMIDEKQLVIYSTNQATQKLIEKVGASGEIKQSQENYFMITEANIAANKSSPYIKNLVTMHQMINLDGTSTIELSIDTSHTSDYRVEYVDPNIPEEKRWLVGDNLSYTKLVLPDKTTLLNSSFTDKQLTVSSEQNSVTFGYYRLTKPLASSKATFTYKVPTKYVFGDQLTINTFMQKQLGGWPYELHYSLTLPTDEYRLQAASNTQVQQREVGNTLTVAYDKMINSDEALSFVYVKK